MRLGLITPVFVLALSPASAQCVVPTPGDRFVSTVTCAATTKNLHYRCRVMVKLRSSGGPVCGATLTVRFDMPSMPMAHNIAPKALKTEDDGLTKEWEQQLDMLGEWRVRVDISGTSSSQLFNFQRDTVNQR